MTVLGGSLCPQFWMNAPQISSGVNAEFSRTNTTSSCKSTQSSSTQMRASRLWMHRWCSCRRGVVPHWRSRRVRPARLRFHRPFCFPWSWSAGRRPSCCRRSTTFRDHQVSWPSPWSLASPGNHRFHSVKAMTIWWEFLIDEIKKLRNS